MRFKIAHWVMKYRVAVSVLFLLITAFFLTGLTQSRYTNSLQ